jgi:hypothetical protein
MPTLLNSRKMLFVDGIGALVSATLLGFVLVRFNDNIGMPVKVLHQLAAVAGIFAVYSFTTYMFVKENCKPYLKVIAIANLLYCCLTVGLMVYFKAELTTLGLIYFIGEVLVILALVIVELKTAFRN